MHGFRWETHWWGSSYSSRITALCISMWERCLLIYLDVIFSQQLVEGSWSTVCGAYSRRKNDANLSNDHALLVLYTPKVDMSPVTCLTSLPWWPSISAKGMICLEQVCFRITCWFDSRKQMSRVKKLHRVYSLEVSTVFFKGILQPFLETHQESRSWIQTLQPRAWHKALDGE